MDGKPRLLDRVREQIRLRHYSMRTEHAYVQWIRRFILFHGKRHPREMSAPEVEAFLSHLAVQRNVAASTQNQALSAILFLYRDVLNIELPWLQDVVWAKKPTRLPVVLRTYSHRVHQPRLAYSRLRVHSAQPPRVVAPLVIHSAIRLRRIYWKPAMTSARSKSCLAIKTSGRR